ncbi:hypothetical protein TUM19329_09590 [Legionella antarctica]|uniref:Coiled-coil protein n=1 Tax=Legionella antarctica TaxID=2708020 RepID=A0A6F8T2H9_9GAMM|nr:hypothetical protein [Legionella antarctica]BCA94598.1 hypothetical protein TUM19329_09590 [Legionella antarctica]
MTFQPQFFVATIDLKEKIKHQEQLKPADFTILSHLLTDDLEASLSLLHECIVAFPKEFVRNLVCLEPDRLIEHEILAQLQATIKLDRTVDDETDSFGYAFTQVQAVLSRDSKQELLEGRCEKLYSETKNEISGFFGTLIENKGLEEITFSPKEILQLTGFYQQLAENEPWKNNAQLLQAVCEQRGMALIYTQRAQELIGNVIKEEIDVLCDAGKLEKLDPVSKKNGVGIFTTGGVASGKGTCLQNISDSLKERRPVAINWNELVHHNADRLKPFLLQPQKDPMKYSQFTYEESLLIKERIMKIIEQQGKKSGFYPHFLHDQTKLKADELKEANQRYDELIITAVSTDAASAIERAFARGEKTTRYEHTEGLLGSHQAVPGELIKSLTQEELIGKGNISVAMYDNNSPSRMLSMFASIDMQKKEIIVYDDVAMQNWIKKENINPKAKTEEELYLDKPVRQTELYFHPMIQQGFTLAIVAKAEIGQTMTPGNQVEENANDRGFTTP